jgi:hypothetical protein
MQSMPMKATIEHARGIAEPLSRSLALLEVRVTAIAVETAQQAILQTWLTIVDDVEHGRADLSSAYLTAIHARLTTAAGLDDSAGFAEHGLPILPDGSRESWSRFVQECRYDDEEGLEEEYALAQLRWGEHVRVFAISLGWFAMNIVRMRRGEDAVYPPPGDQERFLRFLKYAGPDSYDAEGGLRGLAQEYARQQAQGIA